MDFNDRINALAARIQRQINAIQTEEAAKTAFVMPFIQALGYDVFDPLEVVPEFIADVGSKKGEKIDYAIMADGEPSILIECKNCSCDIGSTEAAQLRRYFHVTTARIGILTNGYKYMFFSDIDEKNIMDAKPFMEINLLELDANLIPELKRLSKSSFELEQMLSVASKMKYVREVKNFFEEQMVNPDQEFVRMAIANVYPGMKTQAILEQFTPIVKQAIGDIINDKINSMLKSALAGQQTTAVSVEAQECETENDGIITTEEELEGYYIVRSILRPVVDINRIFYRDTKSHFGILFDDNNRKPICRLHFNRKKKYIGVFDQSKKEIKMPVDTLDDIYEHTELIQSAAMGYVTGRIQEALEGIELE